MEPRGKIAVVISVVVAGNVAAKMTTAIFIKKEKVLLFQFLLFISNFKDTTKKLVITSVIIYFKVLPH